MLSVLYVVGLQCEFNVDDCAPKPGSLEPLCKNGGQCEDGVGGYKCNCPAGFTGDHCEGDLNECKTRPCHSHGSLDCIQLVDNYQCRCRLGYTGIFTLTSENNTTAPQVIFAVFLKRGRNVFVSSGRHCESMVDLCLSSPCRNGGVCSMNMSSVHGYSCSCPRVSSL